jgi:hypothetical protein
MKSTPVYPAALCDKKRGYTMTIFLLSQYKESGCENYLLVSLKRCAGGEILQNLPRGHIGEPVEIGWGDLEHLRGLI